MARRQPEPVSGRERTARRGGRGAREPDIGPGADRAPRCPLGGERHDGCHPHRAHERLGHRAHAGLARQGGRPRARSPCGSSPPRRLRPDAARPARRGHGAQGWIGARSRAARVRGRRRCAGGGLPGRDLRGGAPPVPLRARRRGLASPISGRRRCSSRSRSGRRRSATASTCRGSPITTSSTDRSQPWSASSSSSTSAPRSSSSERSSPRSGRALPGGPSTAARRR